MYIIIHLRKFYRPAYIPRNKVNTYKTIILPVVLYDCETLSLTLREKHGLKVFENEVF